LDWVLQVRPSEQWSSSPLFTCNVNSGGQPEKRKKKEADLAVLVTHGAYGGGIVVAMDSSGSRQRSFFFSPLLHCAIFFCCFSFHLSTMLFPLCSGFVAVLLWRRRGRMARRARHSRRCFFVYFPFYFFSCFFFSLFLSPPPLFLLAVVALVVLALTVALWCYYDNGWEAQ